MDFQKLKKALNWLKENNYPRINIMGGEPLLYSRFEDFFIEAQKKEFHLTLITNGTIAFPKRLNPREGDAVLFNASFLDHPLFLKNLAGFSSKFSALGFSPVLVNDCKIDQLLSKVEKFLVFTGKNGIPKQKISFTLSLDCRANIFKEKKKLNADLLKIVEFFSKNKISFSSDHSVPLCFFEPRSRLILKKNRVFSHHQCHQQSAGVLDADFRFGFCSVYPGKRFPLFKKNGEAISFSDYQKKIEAIFKEKIESKKESLCSQCSEWGEKCNGGCFPNAQKV
jgi:hypothetical protein